MRIQANTRIVCLGIVSLLLPVALNAQTTSSAAPPTKPAAPKSPWVTSVSLALKETFDSNVYIQDTTPDPANVAAASAAGLNAASAKQGSFVTSVQPRLGLDYKPSPAFYGSVAYAPELTYYHSALNSPTLTTGRKTTRRWCLGHRPLMPTGASSPETSFRCC